MRLDDANDDVRAAFESLRQIAIALITATEGAASIAGFGQKTAQFNAAKYDTVPMQLLGIGDVSSTVEQTILSGWTAENVALIRNVNADQLVKLETLFLRALRDGTRSSQLTSEIASIMRVSVSRAQLIGRDQIGKLNGQLDRQKQTDAGINSYVWRGALDARERPSHVAREGQVFRWDDPPPDGNPGQPVRCRCSGEPNLEPLLGSEFAPEPTPRSALPTEEDRKEHRRRMAERELRRRRR